MQLNSSVKFSPIVADDKKIEVFVEDDQAVLKLSTWTEDLGWCGQKTLSFDAEMLGDLQNAISAAWVKLKKNIPEATSKETTDAKSTNVLIFPLFG